MALARRALHRELTVACASASLRSRRRELDVCAAYQCAPPLLILVEPRIMRTTLASILLMTAVATAATAQESTERYRIQQPRGTWQQPGPIQQPRGTWQQPGEIRQPTGPWREPGPIQEPTAAVQQPGEIQEPKG